MRIDFKKITPQSRPFSLTRDVEGGEVVFNGSFHKEERGLVVIDATLKGSIELDCDLTGEPFIYELDEEIHIKASDGVVKGGDAKYDIVEFFDGYVDFDEILYSELEAVRYGYHTKPDASYRDTSY